MRKTLLQMTFLISMLMLAGCASARNTASSPASTPTSSSSSINVYVSASSKSAAVQNTVYALNGSTGKLLWNYDSGASQNYSPTLDHGVLYLGNATGVYALNTQNGKRLWNYPTSDYAIIMGIVNGVIYARASHSINSNSSTQSTIFALNASDGSARWAYKQAGPIINGALLDGVMYATATQGNCECSAPMAYNFALDASDGSVRWKTAANSDQFAALLAANGLIYGADGYPEGPVSILQALKSSDGSVRWRFPASPSASTSIVGLDSHAIYLLSNDGDFVTNPNVFYALNPHTGAVLWRSVVKDAPQANATLLNSTIYIGSSDGSLTALNAADGKQVWRARVGQADPANDNNVAVKAVIDGIVYLAYPQGFAALSASDGGLKWQYQAGGVLAISDVVNGIVYASSSDIDPSSAMHNAIYALKASDGSLIWRYDAPATFFTPIVG